MNDQEPKMKTIIKMSWLAAALLLTACANHKNNSPRVDYQQFIHSEGLKQVSKITHFRMTRWQSLDHRFFIINASKNRNYLVEVMGYCPDLKYGHTLRLVQSMSSSLQSKFDSVIVDSDPNQKCTIKNIYPLSKEQKDQLISKETKASVKAEKEL